jgi:hypothetical protein
MSAAAKSLETNTSVFLKSLGYACPSFMLYCLLHLLDQHIESICSAWSRTMATPPIEIDGVQTADDITAVSALDFLENSYKLCRLIELLLLHRSASSSSSASHQVCQTQLTSFGMDWRQVWLQRFVSRRLQSFELTLIHPMLMTYLWQIRGEMDKDMEIQTIMQMQFTDRGGGGGNDEAGL